MKKIGLLVRSDATGLGMQTQDWSNHLPISKVMVVGSAKQNFPEIYQNKSYECMVCERGIPTLDEINKFLEGLDIVLTIETPYNWNLFSKAKERGIKTVMAVNYEFFPEVIPFEPDFYIAYNLLNKRFLDDLGKKNVVYLQNPIDRKQFEFKLREKADTFLINNGNGGIHGRNCLQEFLQAIPLVKSDVKFIINSQYDFDSINDSRVTVNTGDLPLKDIYAEGDVFVHLRKFGAGSLPMNEAASLGMPILGVNRYPENEMFIKEFLVDSDGSYMLKSLDWAVPVQAEIVSPIKIAKKIDELAHIDITKHSHRMNEIAEEMSWDTWKDKWLQFFETL